MEKATCRPQVSRPQQELARGLFVYLGKCLSLPTLKQAGRTRGRSGVPRKKRPGPVGLAAASRSKGALRKVGITSEYMKGVAKIGTSSGKGPPRQVPQLDLGSVQHEHQLC